MIYTGQSNTNWWLSSAVSEGQTGQKRCSLSTLCSTGLNWPVPTWRPRQAHLNLLTSLQFLKSAVRKDKGPTHNPGAVIAASANTCLLYGQPDEKAVDKGFWRCQSPYCSQQVQSPFIARSHHNVPLTCFPVFRLNTKPYKAYNNCQGKGKPCPTQAPFRISA